MIKRFLGVSILILIFFSVFSAEQVLAGVFSVTPTANSSMGNVLSADQNTLYSVGLECSCMYVHDVSDRENPITRSTISLNTTNPYNIVVNGNYVYINGASNSIDVVDVSSSTNPVLVKTIIMPHSQPGGSKIRITDGYLIIAGSTPGNPGAGYMMMYSLASSSNPVLSSEISLGVDAGPADVLKRGNYVYVAGYFDHTLNVIDVSNLASPVITQTITNVNDPADYHPFDPWMLLTKDNVVYLADDEIIQVYDASNPATLSYVKSVLAYQDIEGAQILGNILYYSASFARVIAFYDVTDAMNPTLITTLSTAKNTQWMSVDNDGNMFVNSREDNTLNIFSSFRFVSSKDSMTLLEGRNDGFTLRLATQPTSDVMITLSTTTPVSGSGITISKTSLTFTTSNWNTPQSVTVTSMDDNTYDGDRSVKVSFDTSSSDPDFNNILLSDIDVSISEVVFTSVLEWERPEGATGHWDDGSTWGNSAPGIPGYDYPDSADEDVVISNATVTLDGDISMHEINIIPEATLSVEGTSTLNVYGDWTNRGTFSSGSSTVNLVGTNQYITGPSTFFNLVKNVTSADTLYFDNSATTTITNNIDLSGISSGKLTLQYHRTVPFDFYTKFGTSGSGEGEFNHPEGVAVDTNDDFYVVDTENNRIQKFDSSGNFLYTIGWGVIDGTDVFQKCTSNCLAGIAGSNEFYFPRGIAIDSSHNIYVTDTGNNKIDIFDSEGNIVNQFGSSESDTEKFGSIYGIAVDSHGVIYVVDADNGRIQKFDINGNYLGTVGLRGDGDGQFDAPMGITIDSSDNVYVNDYHGGPSYVVRFNSSGVYQGRFGGDNLFSPTASAVDPTTGEIYVSNDGAHIIDAYGADFSHDLIFGWGVIDNSSTLQFCFVSCITSGLDGGGDGQFNNPRGIAMTQSGGLIVVNSASNNVNIFSKTLPVWNIDVQGAHSISDISVTGSRSASEITCADCTDGGSNVNWSFTSSSMPAVSLLSVSSVATTSVILNASTTDTGLVRITDRGFNWGTTSSYGNTASTTGSFGYGAFSQTLSGLTCGTTYNYRAFVTNVVGTATTSDSTFTTADCPITPDPTPTPTPPPSSGGSSSSGSYAFSLNTPSKFNQSFNFTRNLTTGNSGNDVKNLQKYLNSKGFIIALAGPGSKGNETNFFGGLTRQALARFQKANKIYPPIGYFGPITRAFVAKNP